MGIITSLVRVIAGFLLASLVAGFVTVLFVITPTELKSAAPDVIASLARQMVVLALLAATHTAIFAASFAAIAIVIAEGWAIRNFVYYLFAGTVIAVLGFFTEYASEVGGQPTIMNNYGLKAFMTAGFFAGLTYWLFAGQWAGRLDPEDGAKGVQPSGETDEVSPAPPDDSASSGEASKRPSSLSERLEVAEDACGRRAAEDRLTAPPPTPDETEAAETEGSEPSPGASATGKNPPQNPESDP